MKKKVLIVFSSLVVATILLAASAAGLNQKAAPTDSGIMHVASGEGDRQTCEWNVGDPFKMHFPQLPDEEGWAVNATWPLVLADDFRCTQTGYIKDVHFWGSWKNDIAGDIYGFQLSFHENIPADQSPTGYSIPGPPLWDEFISIDLFDIVQIDPPTSEGWYDPFTGETINDDHYTYYQYDVCFDDFMDTLYMFYQTRDSIYWLNISAEVNDPFTYQWGWKSSEWHWMDDAVWGEFPSYQWEELYEPDPVTNPIVNTFWIEFDSLGMPDTANTGGTEYYDDGTSVNGWYFYPLYGWWNIWFYDHPFDPTRYKEIFLNFEWYVTDYSDYFIEVAVNWSTPDWPPGSPPPVPPLDPADEDLFIHREYLTISSEGPQYFGVTVPDYNPEWVSVDVMGRNVIIVSAPPGVIEHWCLPLGDPVSMDLAFVITGDEPCSPSLDVEKKVWDMDAGDWVDSVDILVGDFADFQITIHNTGTCCDLTDIVVIDTLGNGFNFDFANPFPDDIIPIAEGTELTWNIPVPLPVGDSIVIDITAEVLGPAGQTDTNYVFVEAFCQSSGEYAYGADQAYVHAYEGQIECGDVDGDGQVNIGDLVYLIDYMFDGGPAPVGDADVDECGSVNIGDAWYLVMYLFMGGLAPCEGAVDCNIPTGDNSIDLGCQVLVEDPTGDSVAIPIYVTNDTPLGAISAGFVHNSPDIEITSVSFNGTILPSELQRGHVVNLAANEVEIFWISMFGGNLAPQTGGLLATMWAQIPPGTPEQTVDIDTSFVMPATEIVFIRAVGGQISPAYYDCGTSDIVITKSQTYICGDADGSGDVDIDDVVYLISYIFTGGPPPDPLAAGDADCSGDVDIDDVVYTIAYIFSGGNAPCDPDGNGTPDC